MVVTKSITVTQRGVGKPDYSRDVSSGQMRPGLTLKYNQSLKSFGRTFTPILSPFSYVTAVLAPGVTAHLIDSSTGVDMPVAVPKGYTLSMISASASYSQDALILIYFDGFLLANFGYPAGGNMSYQDQIIGHGTALLDPTALSAHTIDITITNEGSGDLEGGGSVFAILNAVGTPPLPTIKTVRCKFCGYKETVPQTTINWICPKCGELNIFYDITGFRGS